MKKVKFVDVETVPTIDDTTNVHKKHTVQSSPQSAQFVVSAIGSNRQHQLYNLDFKFSDRHIDPVLPIPLQVLFQDVVCSAPSKVIQLSGWSFTHHDSKLRILKSIAEACKDTVESLSMDYCCGLDLENDLDILRGRLTKLKKLSLAGLARQASKSTNKDFNAPFGPSAAVIVCSLRSITSLNLSDNAFTDSKSLFVSISETLLNLKSIFLVRCDGILDSCLRSLGQCIQRFRRLGSIDLSYCSTDFGDDGLVDLVSAVSNHTYNINMNAISNYITSAMQGI